jgi:hypothetical protein
MTIVRTLKHGSTVTDRRLNTWSAAPSADPVATDEGHHLQGADFLHLYVDLGAATAATITPWYYSEIAGKWFEGDPIVFNAANQFALVQTSGEEKVFMVLDAITGAGPVQVWGGYSHESKDAT